MKIEILYPEICNLFGEQGNTRYLRHCLPEAAFHETLFGEEPLFMRERPDFIYMGCTTEGFQDKLLQSWPSYRARLLKLIDDGVPMLFTGNAGELLFTSIDCWDGRKIPALGIFPMRAKRPRYDRYNGLTLGNFQNRFETVGFRCQFTFWYEDSPVEPFVQCLRGIGQNRKSKREGAVRNNCIVTSQLGPLLPYNPPLLRHLFAAMGAPDTPLAFADEVERVYQARLREFKRSTTRFELKI